MKLYKLFSKYVTDTFLTADKKGEFASLVIDEQFMEDAASKFNTMLDEFVKDLSEELFYRFTNINTDIDYVIAVVAIQLYAASKCETDEDYSANAYNPRLCEIINCELGFLQNWYKDNQEKIWRTFYTWCYNNSFIVRECPPRDRKNKYVQYPMELAKYSLNRDDLKYTASLFNQYKLLPYENVFYSDFWRILDIRDFTRLNNHISKVFDAVFEDTHSYDILQSQIYNHFLVWDGEYIDPYEQRTNKIRYRNLFQIHLSDKDNKYRIDVRKEDGSKVSSFQIDSIFVKELSKYYSFKRDGVIIFQKSEAGDFNYWDETRLIDNKEDRGIAIVLQNSQQDKFYDAIPVFYSRDIVIYEFNYNDLTKEFYSNEDEIYTLIGGLKIKRNRYLIGGEPILRVHKDCVFLIDSIPCPVTKGDYDIELSEGEHIIKFPQSRELKLTIESSSLENIEWSNKFCKWELERLIPKVNKEGVLGLDFAQYSRNDKSQSTLRVWAKLHHKEKLNSANNISLRLLNNINKYG